MKKIDIKKNRQSYSKMCVSGIDKNFGKNVKILKIHFWLKFAFLFAIIFLQKNVFQINNTFAQQNVLQQKKLQKENAQDSLTILLKKDQKSDAEKVRTLLLMARSLRNKYPEKSLLYAQQALLFSDKTRQDNLTGETLYSVAQAYYRIGNYPKALEYNLRAVKIYKQTQQIQSEALLLQQVGHIYVEFGDYEQGIFYHAEALKIYEKINQPIGVATVTGYLGQAYLQSKNLEYAKENFEKAIEIAEKQNNPRIIAINQINLGEWAFVKQNYAQALRYYQTAQKTLNELKDPENEGHALNGIGEVYAQLNQSREALVHYQKALFLEREANDVEGMATVYLDLGELYLKQKTYTDAQIFLLKSLELAKNLRAKKIIRDVYYALSKIQEAQGLTLNAYQNFKLYKTYHDSIYNESRLTVLSEMQARLGLNKKEKENQAQKQVISLLNQQQDAQKQILDSQQRNIRLQTTVIIVVIAGLVLLGLFAWILFKSRKESREHNTILHKINQEITRQNEEINKKNTEITLQNQEIQNQKNEIEKKTEQLTQTYTKITDSIRYAETIQQSILPQQDKLQDILHEFFVISKAKDIVSGDFYWVSKIENSVFVAVVDCTGHGVSGAMMTMIGHTLLNEIINQKKVSSPAVILAMLNEGLVNITSKQSQEIAIGMEIGLCRLDDIPTQPNHTRVIYAGAKRPFISISLDEVNNRLDFLEIRGDRETIGFAESKEKAFQNQEITMQKGSVFYLASDGYIDQANPKNQRIGSPKLKEILQNIAQQPLTQQKQALEDFLLEHQQHATQRDDITLMGVRV